MREVLELDLCRCRCLSTDAPPSPGLPQAVKESQAPDCQATPQDVLSLSRKLRKERLRASDEEAPVQATSLTATSRQGWRVGVDLPPSRDEGEASGNAESVEAAGEEDAERCASESDMITYGISSRTWKTLVSVAGVPCASYSTDSCDGPTRGASSVEVSKGHHVARSEVGDGAGMPQGTSDLGAARTPSGMVANETYQPRADDSKVGGGCRGPAEVSDPDGIINSRSETQAVLDETKADAEASVGRLDGCHSSLRGSITKGSHQQVFKASPAETSVRSRNGSDDRGSVQRRSGENGCAERHDDGDGIAALPRVSTALECLSIRLSGHRWDSCDTFVL